MSIAEATNDRLAEWANPSWWKLLVLVPWMLGVVLSAYGCLKYRAIADRQQRAEGIVTVHQAENHNRYGYTFFVDSHRYTGWDSPRKVEPEIGKSISIYYDPRDPAENSMSDYSQKSLDSFGPVPLLLFGIGGVTLFVYWRRRLSAEAASGQRA
jgi:hypothetical protein